MMDRAVLEMLAEHSTLALVACDVEGRITLATPAMQRMIGAPFEAGNLLEHYVAVMPLFDQSGQQAWSREHTSLARALRGETVMDDLVSLRQPEGRTIFARCNAAPLRNPDGQIRGAVVLVQDVTPEWTATLMQDQLRDRLVSTVNHELRTPLTKILGHAELLTEPDQDNPLSAQQVRSVEAILRAGRDLASMAERLAQLAHLDTATRVQPTDLDLVAVLQSEIEAHRQSGRTRRVEISFESPPELQATMDSTLIQRAVRELLTNAVRHAPRDSTIDVELRDFDREVEISFADQGEGIPAGDRKRLIEPFERGDLPEGLTSSTGLGLAFVNAVVAAHGGSFELQHNGTSGLLVCMRLQRFL